MTNINIAWLVSAVALIVTTLVFPVVLRFARRHHIVDNPNARKLQRVPVPVLGGVAVYLGIMAGGITLTCFLQDPMLIWGMLAMTIMQAIGTWDDIRDLPATLRFAVEIILVTVLLLITGMYMDDLHGLWGVHGIDTTAAVLLSILSGVGIINAVNLIDGVDGYSSGYGIMASACFAFLFWTVDKPVMMCMALVVMASLLPFFFHNVFGVRSKMFIGDGGTLMLGMLMTIFVFYTISSKGACATLEQQGVGLAALTLAVLCIPVFDTLRVMTARILRGKSPFSPDKTHLHHLFIDMGFSHLGAAFSILLINSLVIVAWIVLWQTGVSITGQFYAVVLMGLMVTTGFYKFMKMQQNGGKLDSEGYPEGTAIWHIFCHLGEMSHMEKGVLWGFLRRLMDRRMFAC